MRPAFTLSALGAALLLAASPAQSIGFGRIANGTQLGQRLDFAATVQLAANEILPRECIAAEVSSGENKLQPGQLRITLEGPNGSPDRRVRITSTSVIDEPVVTVRVTLGCSSKISRTFVTFIDPPLIYAAHGSPQVLAAELPVQRSDSQVAPLLATVEGAPKRTSTRSRVVPTPTSALLLAGASQAQSPSSQRRPSRDISSQGTAQPAQRQRAERMAVALAAARTVARATTRTVSAPSVDQRIAGAAVPQRAKPVRASATTGPRLKLDAAPTASAFATTTPVLAVAAGGPASVDLAASAAIAASVATVDGLTAELAIERERVHGLEQNQVRLASESKAVQATLLAMQTRFKATEAGRDSSRLLDLLAWLVGGLTLAVGVLVWQQMRARRAVAWWQQAERASRLALESALPVPADEVVVEPVPAITAEPVAIELVVREATDAQPVALIARPVAFPVDDMTRPAPFVMSAPRSIFESSRGVALSVAMATTVAKIDEPTLPASSVSELSVEELIDLEQQADFFAVLGQDDAAIDLLMSHVLGAGNQSPLPYLNLLEIHRRLGNMSAYQNICERFNDRFNARAPEWETDLQMGRGLVDYPNKMAQLASLWNSLSRAMQILDAAVFRRDDHEEPFELPAYRELLLLYSVARDLAAADGVLDPDCGVDLLLPLDPFDDAPITCLVATEPLADARDGKPATAPVDLDISFEPVELPATRSLSLAQKRSKNPNFSSDTQYPDLDPDVEIRGAAASGFYIGAP